ncbi:MAG TPA: DUF882 domain-containing protein [Steroidobacteraceae bacterium]|jgi:uncharacterized protein YcbK (DUF882 family)|nr:DUF882 domain-containing protein [Steroidobacteraceae bacterium]
MNPRRRRILSAAGVLAGLSAAGVMPVFAHGRAPTGAADAARGSSDAQGRGAGGAGGAEGDRSITLISLHTDEHLAVEYARGGAYLPAALDKIENVLRDFRTGDRHVIDPALMDYLCDAAQALGVQPRFRVISGYRSPKTNAQLHERSAGVAQHSLHMEGRAIDVRLAGIDCADLAARAVQMQRGGVGYYRASDFVHLDTGRFRTWKG